MVRTVREQHHRLPEEVYRGFEVASFTACVKERIQFFTVSERFFRCEEMLLAALKQFECGAEVYLFMPDHVHLLLRGESKIADVLSAMKTFKHKTGFWLYQNYRSVRWQKDFYDHILRKEEDVGMHIRYILGNPVRANLANDWKEYAFKGSTIYNLDELDLW